MWSCAEKEITPTAPDGSKPIEFGSLSTRALVTDIIQVKEFGVSCAISNADNSDYGSIMDNVKVERSNKSTTGWDYNPKRYWLEDSYFYFVASYPFVDGGGFQPYYESGNFIGYFLNVDTSAQDDILIDSEYVNTSDSWSNTVNFQFRHLLTNVNFIISKEDSNQNHYEVTKVSLQGVSTKGNYIAIPNMGAIGMGWDSIESGSYEKDIKNGILKEKETLTIWDTEEGGLLVIPELGSTSSVKLVIDYKYQLYVSNDGTNTEQPEVENKQVAVNVPTSMWESGKKIVYNLTITDPNRIKFTRVDVEKWGNAQAGGTIIIK